MKCRRKHYNTLRIQEDKYDHLQQFNRKFYICSTPAGIYAFDVDTITPTWSMTWNPETTDFDRIQMVLKSTYDIPIYQGVNLTERILNHYKNKQAVK